jgi:hypothetical protein
MTMEAIILRMMKKMGMNMRGEGEDVRKSEVSPAKSCVAESGGWRVNAMAVGLASKRVSWDD